MKVFRLIERHVEEVLLVIILSTMVIAIFLQIVMRFVLGTSLGWSEELARYSFIYLVFIGVSYGVKQEKHIRIDTILSFLNEKKQVILSFIVYSLFLLFSIFIIVYGGAMSIEIFRLGQVTPGLEKWGMSYMAAPLGMVLTSLRISQKMKAEFQHYLHARPYTLNEKRNHQEVHNEQ
ncbi:LOW QUALITY PROTEIN: TRAP-type C4-dicarboxylate transport system, small permease component [Bacillus sp. JCM 19047]|nr:LOW QUALITY PROTEIN: TRAP-type C4-dicarboxylate transport system, small permease component [Bacillus sp. JCM 19047]